MTFSAEQLNMLLVELNARSRKVRESHDATHPRDVVLSPVMSAILGTLTRRTVPILDVAVEAISSKLFVRDITTDKATLTKQLRAWLKANTFELLERELYRHIVRDGTAYILASWGASGPVLTVKEAYDGMDGAAAVCSEMDDSTLYTVNTWLVGGTRYLDCYFDDRIEKYIALQGRWELRRDAPDETWPVPWVNADGEPLGSALIAIGDGESRIRNSIQLGDDFNAALLDMAALSRSQGWPQRFMTGGNNEFLVTSNGQPLRDEFNRPVRRRIIVEPGSILTLGDNKIEQLDAATLDTQYLRELISLISLSTGVPQHVFTGDWPSGIALQSAEIRLNEKVEDLQGVISPSLISMVRLMVKMSALFGGPVYAEPDISVSWYPPEIESEDLRQGRDKATKELYAAGLMSMPRAVATLHPEWSDEQISDECALILSAETGRAQRIATNNPTPGA